MKNNTMVYLNPNETKAIARLSYEKAAVVTLEQMRSWFKYPPVVLAKTVARLKNKGILTAITKGVYFYSPLEAGPSGTSLNEYLVPPILFPKGNYYVGYTGMYNYYGFLDQIPQTMYILNTALQREKSIGKMTFKLVKIPPSRLYGTVKVSLHGGEVLVGDRERTLVDLLYFPDAVGGLKKAFEILEQQAQSRKADVGKLVKYAALFPNKSTRKRIGYVLEKAGVKEGLLKPLLKSVEKSALVTLYGSKSRKGPINKKWKVILDAA